MEPIKQEVIGPKIEPVSANVEKEEEENNSSPTLSSITTNKTSLFSNKRKFF